MLSKPSGAALILAGGLGLLAQGCQDQSWVLGGGRGAGSGGTDAGAGSCASGVTVPTELLSFLDDRVGHGRAVTGGATGCMVLVTTLADDGPGSLRAAVAGDPGDPARWIRFAVSGEIELASEITLPSDLTVDGRGQDITLTRCGLRLGKGTSNVLLESLKFAGGSSSEGDAVGIADGARGIWIDHCAFSDFGDGLIDVSRAGTDVTVSYSHFFDHDKVMLLGAKVEDQEDAAIRVTLHHNWFEQTGTYHPRLRFGRAHSFNNLFDRWKSWASGASQGGQLYSEANIYAAGKDTTATVVEISDDPSPGYLRSVGDKVENGALIVENEPGRVDEPSRTYSYSVAPADDALRAALMSLTGPRAN